MSPAQREMYKDTHIDIITNLACMKLYHTHGKTHSRARTGIYIYIYSQVTYISKYAASTSIHTQEKKSDIRLKTRCKHMHIHTQETYISKKKRTHKNIYIPNHTH